jgi:hypothetical protein
VSVDGPFIVLDVAKRHRGLRALEEPAAMGEGGDFGILLDKDNYRR